MIHSTKKIQIRYAETDQMKFVYYGNYAQYFELARIDMLDQIGLPYYVIEKKG